MINFHTHGNINIDGISVVSLFVNQADKIEASGFYSMGVHPWNTSDPDVDEQLAKLSDYSKNENIIAIGEIGLDRLRGADLKKQIEILNQQVLLAEKVAKPVIIHCVRAWPELIALKNRHTSPIKWAIHGFRGNPELAQQLIENEFFISFGTDIINPTPNLAESLTITPLNRMFFETDDSPIPLYEVYSAASDILDLPVSMLKEQITSNFKEFFR